MSFIKKPLILHRGLERNELGLTIRDYEGSMSTLCAGCGHDSITAAIIQAFFELSIEPHRVAKMSGIGCSSKTPTYFMSSAHGFNSVHGRMPSIATGANAANRELVYIGVSGDGDSLSIGLGQFAHALRRNLNMLYIIENNGVYGLTKGQFSASSDIGSKAKYGEVNTLPPIDPVQTAIAMGGTFVARSFSGDKGQLVPLIKAAISHNGFALLDVISPCVTFNDHESSTKSYAYTRQHRQRVVHTDFIPRRNAIEVEYEPGQLREIEMHDGNRIRLRKSEVDYNPHNRGEALDYIRQHHREGEVVTGLLYIDDAQADLHGTHATTTRPLNALDYGELCPGADVLAAIERANR